MAEFKPSTSSSSSPWNLQEERPPEGSFVAKIIACQDEFGVTRPKFENPMENEVVDRTIFLFGFRDKAGHPHKIASRWMRISGNEKSALFQFLRSACGKPFPYGQDYSKDKSVGGMIGRDVLITINHEAKKNGSGTYPVILSISPVPEGFSQAAAVPQPIQQPTAPVAAQYQAPAQIQQPASLPPTGTNGSDDGDIIPF